MEEQLEGLPILSFASATELDSWLAQHHATSAGIWVRVGKINADFVSITFDELLDAAVCYGWSESKRRKGDEQSYLQCFTPRRTKGTTSQRNKARVARLIEEGKMTSAGLRVLSQD